MEEKIERRGRPASAIIDPDQQPKKFTREYKDHSGHRSVWTYDLDKNPNGPICVEQIYAKGFEVEEFDPTSADIPKTKRMYYNEKNGKLVGYTRYCALLKEQNLPPPI